ERPMTEHLAVLRIDRVDPPLEPTLDELDHALMADRALAPAGTDDRHRSPPEHALEGGTPVLGRHRGFLTARSLTAARYACQPGMPFTPPPACAADEPWCRPLSAVREARYPG